MLSGQELDRINDAESGLIRTGRLSSPAARGEVFIWPSADGSDGALRPLVYRGYNVVTWSKGGIVHWAISDLNMAEMRPL
jgi:anti-sigma factor RsiW